MHLIVKLSDETLLLPQRTLLGSYHACWPSENTLIVFLLSVDTLLLYRGFLRRFVSLGCVIEKIDFSGRTETLTVCFFEGDLMNGLFVVFGLLEPFLE